LRSYAIGLRHASILTNELAAALRKSDPPIVARVHNGRVLLDLRTVTEDQDTVLSHNVLTTCTAVKLLVSDSSG
jgi:L-seryl-tRNA(Ser) seleniumtransferase